MKQYIDIIVLQKNNLKQKSPGQNRWQMQPSGNVTNYMKLSKGWTDN